LTTFLFLLQGQWIFQTLNCSEISENNFSSTQVKRAEQSSTSEVYIALRKQTEITMKDFFYWREKEKVFSTEGVFELGYI